MNTRASISTRPFPNSERLFRFGLAALFVAPLLLCLQPLLRGHIPDSMDTTLYFYPLRAEAARLLGRGEWPWWTRSILCGAPLFSNPQMGLAYPGRWLFLAFPSGFTFYLGYPLHLGLWAALTAWALRGAGVGVGRGPALWVGAMCVAGSYGWSRFQYGTFIDALPWWAVWLGAAERYARGGSRRWLVAGAVAVAMPLLAGAHQLFVYSALGFGVLIALRAALDRRRARRWLGFAVFAALVGVALGSAGWWPQILFLRETNRADALAVPHALAGSFQSIPEILRAFIGPWGKGVADAEASASIGLLALIFACVIPSSKRRRRVWIAFIATALISTAMSLRFVNEQLFQLVPRAALLHDPRRWLGVAHWLWLLAAGVSLDDLTLRFGMKARREFRPDLRPVAPAPWRFAPLAALALAPVGMGLAPESALFPRNPKMMLVLGGTFLVVVARLWFKVFRPRTRRVYAVETYREAILFGALALEFTRTLGSTWATTERRSVDPVELTRPAGDEGGRALPATLKPAPGARIYTVDWQEAGSFDYRRPDKADWALPNLAALFGVEDLAGYEPARSARYDRWIRAASGWPGGQPWPAHFALAYPALKPSPPEAPDLAEANPTHVIMPIWGAPVYVRRSDAGVWAGAAPDAPGVEYRIVVALDPNVRATRAAGLAARGLPIAERPLESSEPAFLNPPKFIESPERFRLFKIRFDEAARGTRSPETIFLRLAPTDLALGVFVWTPEVERKYERVATRDMAGLYRHRDEGFPWAQINMDGGSGSLGWPDELHSNEILINAEIEWGTAQEAEIVVHDSYWPGWSAWIDDQPTELRPSGPEGMGPWRSITIKKPETNDSEQTPSIQLRLAYFPPGLTGALGLTGAALAVCVVIAISGRRKRVIHSDQQTSA